MATAAKDPRTVPSQRQASAPARPSGVMPVFRGKVSLPTPAVANTQLRALPARATPARATPARVDLKDDAQWEAALAAAKQRALVEEEERAWQAAIARAKAQVAEQEAREWAALRARATRAAAPPRRLHSWP